jgi:DNA-binding FrmR family transcriptional regulator
MKPLDFTIRINRIIGQLRGIDRMVVAERDCGDILQQVSAVKKAIDGLSKEIVLKDIGSYLAEGEAKKVEKTLARAINL